MNVYLHKPQTPSLFSLDQEFLTAQGGEQRLIFISLIRQAWYANLWFAEPIIKKGEDVKEKVKSERKHAARRLAERYDLHLNVEQVRSLSNLIRKKHEPRFKGRAVFIDRESQRVTRWFVWYENQWLPVVYDKQRKTIVTVLPAGALLPVPAPFKQTNNSTAPS